MQPSSTASLGADQGSVGSAPPRSLAPGAWWTYRTTGYWSIVDEVTVVLAEASPDGFLFGAATREMFGDEIGWDLPFLGRTDPMMRALRDDAYGGGEHRQRVLDLPLVSGKSWSYSGLLVTAEAARLNVVGNEHDGFIVRGEDDTRRVHIEYAPSIGHVTRFEEFHKGLGDVMWSLELLETGEGKPWHVAVREAETIFSTGSDPSSFAPLTFEVGDGFEEVFIWAQGSMGSRGSVAPPPGTSPPWLFEGGGDATVATTTIPATSGTWRLSGVPNGPDGSVYIQAHPLRWDSG